MVIALGSITPTPVPETLERTSCRDIVNGALRKIGKLAGGREPRVQDSIDALDSLRSLYSYLVNSGAFGRMVDVVPTGATYVAGENERIFRNSSATLDITLPELVRVDAYCGPRSYPEEQPVYSTDPVSSGMRPPRDCAFVAIQDAFTAQTVEYLYDGQIKLWAPIKGLTLESVAPLAERDADGLKCLLATRISDEFGGTMGDMTVRQAGQFMQALTARYSTSATIGRTEYF